MDIELHPLLGKELLVLDNGYVSLVDYMGNDLTVVNAARVSFNKSKNEFKDGDERLVKYLAEHNHWTPFAHPQITMKIKAPISIRTQFFKHKQGFVENEVSGRYVNQGQPDFYYPRWRSKPVNNKQGSGDFIMNEDLEDDVYDKTRSFNREINKAYNMCRHVYNYLVNNGVAPEQARFVLPQGTYTKWYWTGSLAAYARFYNQRIDSHAQWEIREYASCIGDILSQLYPVCWRYLSDHSET